MIRAYDLSFVIELEFLSFPGHVICQIRCVFIHVAVAMERFCLQKIINVYLSFIIVNLCPAKLLKRYNIVPNLLRALFPQSCGCFFDKVDALRKLIERLRSHHLLVYRRLMQRCQ